MRKEFIFNILFLILINIIIKPFWIFGIDAQVQNAVGNDIYGSYYAFLNIALIFQILLDFGLQNYNNKTIANAPASFANLFPNIFITKMLLCICYIIIINSVGFFIGYNFHQLKLLTTISIIPILQSFYLFFRSNIAAFQHFKTDSLLSILDRTLLIIICGSILYIPFLQNKFTINIAIFILIQIISMLIANIIAFKILINKNNIKWENINYKKGISIIKNSLPFAILILLMAVYMRIDSVILERFCGTEVAGQHGAIFRILDVCNNMSGVLVGGMLLSYFSKNIKDKQTIINITRLCNTLFLPIILIGTITIVFWEREIMQTIYKNYIYNGHKTLGLLILSYPMYCLLYIYSTLLTAVNKLKTLTFISIVAAVFAIVSNLIITPIYGLRANLTLHIISMAIVGMSCLMYSIKYFGRALFKIKDALRIVAVIIITSLCAYYINTFNLHFTYKIISTLIGGIISLALFNISAINSLYQKIKIKA
jgi:O-antigen/teichoic acid export membrane protein